MNSYYVQENVRRKERENRLQWFYPYLEEDGEAFLKSNKGWWDSCSLMVPTIR